MTEPAFDREDTKVLFEVLFDLRYLLARLVEFVVVVMTMGKKKRKKKGIPTYREWWEAYREQFERTERHLKERIAYHEAKIAEERAARGEDAA